MVQQTDVLEMDELFWFIGRKEKKVTRENVYIMTLASRNPRQIVAFAVVKERTVNDIQKMIDAAPPAKIYYSDGFNGYQNVVYPGKYIRNCRDKSDTYTVEGVNADLRHYIPMLKRSSRCFARSLETLVASMNVFTRAYNRFEIAKAKYRERHPNVKAIPLVVIDYL